MADTLTAAPPETRYLLPPEAYFSTEWYEREQRELFGRTWNLVAYEHDVPHPGDHLPVQAGPTPVLIVRGHDGELRAFVNMCRHRGMALTCEAGHTDGNVRCPYHGWEFTTEGTLVRDPAAGGPVRRPRHRRVGPGARRARHVVGPRVRQPRPGRGAVRRVAGRPARPTWGRSTRPA